MKNMKRAYRRHKKQVKFLKRLNKWVERGVNKYLAPSGIGFIYKNRSDILKEALAGECYTFLRTTGRPCNCSMCQYNKYKREPRFKWRKEIELIIKEDENND